MYRLGFLCSLVFRARPLPAGRVLLCAVLAVALVAWAGCGGGGPASEEELAEEDGIGEIQFVDEPTREAVPAEQVDVIGRFVQETAILLPDMEFLDTQAFYLDELQRVARDFQSHIEAGEEEGTGLEWVVDVHETVLDWDEIQAVLAQQEFSEDHRVRYGEIYVGLVEAYYRLAFSADRVLGAAVILGPSGRVVEELALDERRRYRILLKQADYFGKLADEKIGEIIESVDAEWFALNTR